MQIRSQRAIGTWQSRCDRHARDDHRRDQRRDRRSRNSPLGTDGSGDETGERRPGNAGDVVARRLHAIGAR